MVSLYDTGVYLLKGKELIADNAEGKKLLEARFSEQGGAESLKTLGKKNTMAYSILEKHNQGESMEHLRIRFDALASHDITYVGIVQTARASGLEKFPVPYVLTNCHNSLCAVGGTINEDDHVFGLSAAVKYGGIYVPAHQAVIHQYMREMMVGCGKMILGSDSHTRYGALGTMAIGEGGGELAKQILNRTYDIPMPGVIGVCLTGKPQPGVGPQDVALAVIREVFANGYVKNKIMEFFGDGVSGLDVEYRNGIDVMTTETSCLSSIWVTDGKVRDYYGLHGRTEAFAELQPGELAYYDGLVCVDLSRIRPMIAMPFHPSHVYGIEELNRNLPDIIDIVDRTANEQLGNPHVRFSLKDKIKNGKLMADQGVIAGCAGGTFDNICEAADLLEGRSIGSGEFSLSVYPSSQPTFMELVRNGTAARLMSAGATMRTAFCGPCFGAGDVPANGAFSVRHTTRNFPNREGSKPSNGQLASVALMDARSVATTAANHGVVTPATDMDAGTGKPKYFFDKTVYENRVYHGFGKAQGSEELRFGPNIVAWPAMSPLPEHLLLRVVSLIADPVTTTDELIPSGETSSYRSNPLGLAEFTLSRKDPAYVGRAKAMRELDQIRMSGGDFSGASMLKDETGAAKREWDEISKSITDVFHTGWDQVGIGSTIYAVKPGDGSAREQAASCQRVLGGCANIAGEYATKRYRSNLINWGMLPFVLDKKVHDDDFPFADGDFLFIPAIKKAVREKQTAVQIHNLSRGLSSFTLELAGLTDDEREILLAGCLINYYKAGE